MARRGGLQGAATAWLTLIVLQGLVSRGGSGRVAGLINEVNRLVVRVLDPTVPAIPDHSVSSAGAGAGASTPVTEPTDRATPRIPVPGINSAQ
jgi:hypothetical protein